MLNWVYFGASKHDWQCLLYGNYWHEGNKAYLRNVELGWNSLKSMLLRSLYD